MLNGVAGGTGVGNGPMLNRRLASAPMPSGWAKRNVRAVEGPDRTFPNLGSDERSAFSARSIGTVPASTPLQRITYATCRSLSVATMTPRGVYSDVYVNGLRPFTMMRSVT